MCDQSATGGPRQVEKVAAVKTYPSSTQWRHYYYS